MTSVTPILNSAITQICDYLTKKHVYKSYTLSFLPALLPTIIELGLSKGVLIFFESITTSVTRFISTIIYSFLMREVIYHKRITAKS